MGKKDEQLGMPFGTANGRLRKLILFNLLQKHKENICCRCSKSIDTPEELSIEHKIPWLDKDTELFWDLDNVAFAHLSCNLSLARKPTKGNLKHGTGGYRRHCRCDECTNKHREYMKYWRIKNNRN